MSKEFMDLLRSHERKFSWRTCTKTMTHTLTWGERAKKSFLERHRWHVCTVGYDKNNLCVEFSHGENSIFLSSRQNPPFLTGRPAPP